MEPNSVKSSMLNPELILNAVKQARKASQPQLREQLRVVREDIEKSRESTRNPLQLFPPEVWLMIVKNTKDFKDVVNCAQSNNILGNMISTPQELLFCKVLPHLVPYFGKRPATTILKCGKVCRKWRNAVDRFADHSFRVKSPPQSGIELITKEPVPGFRYIDILEDDELRIAVRPFLSRLNLPLFPLFNTRLLTLDSVGHCLWKLSLEFATLQSYRSPQIYAECVRAIGKCANLKSFRLLDPSNWQRNINVEDNGVDDLLELQVPSTLESLEMVVKSSGILAVQDVLLQKLSNQLKRLEVTHWNFKSYHTLQWTNLTELEIVDEISLEVLDSLQQTTAPKLWKLYIHWNNNLNFVQLVNVVNQLDGLRHLSILLTETVTDECLAVPIEILTINKLTILEIFSQHLSEGLNVPVLFPMLQHFVYHYGPNAAKYMEFKSVDVNNKNRKNLIRIYKNMYYSNVWTMLPKLETLTLKHVATLKFDQQKYTRLGYAWTTDQHAKGIQMHLKQIREKQKVKMKLKTERDRMQIDIQKHSLAILPQSLIQLDKIDRENVRIDRSFPLILPFLVQKDILSCRLVCRSWKTSVGDGILENCMRNIPLTFSVPLSSHQRLQNFVNFVEKNTRRPFFARRVEIKIMDEDGCVDGIEMMLADLGKYVLHLTISTEIPLELINIFKVCVECLRHCKNLNSFSLHIPFVNNTDFTVFEQVKKCTVLSKPVHLKSFSFYGESFTNPCSGLSALRRHLENTFADQLKALVVPRICINPNLEIRELTITNFKTESTLQAAVYWFGVKVDEELRKLRLCITQKFLCNSDLSDIIVHCKKLKFLELQFADSCSSFDKNLWYWDLFVGRSVTELQIVFRNKHQICLDFLVHFPCVQTLRIIYGKHAVLLNERAGECEQEDESNLSAEGVRSPEYDFIQLARYLKDESLAEHDVRGIYASNIWRVMSRLNTLEILYCAKEHTRDRKMFHRRS